MLDTELMICCPRPPVKALVQGLYRGQVSGCHPNRIDVICQPWKVKTIYSATSPTSVSELHLPKSSSAQGYIIKKDFFFLIELLIKLTEKSSRISHNWLNYCISL